MARKILDLPNEILDACLKELLPPLSPYDNTFNSIVPVPLDLWNLMFVCRAFEALALPWVWRRVQIHDTGRQDPTPWRWTCLRDHPEVASHIRFLSLYAGPHTVLQTLLALQTAAALMANLQFVVLRLRGDDGLGDIINQLYATLISRPQLHTVVSRDHILPNFRELSSRSLTRLRRLHIAGWDGHEQLLEMTPCLESLAITGPAKNEDHVKEISIPWTTMSIPWATLRDITIYDSDRQFMPMHDWYGIEQNFSSWKISFPDKLSPLTEIFVNLLFVTITAHQIRLLAVFGPQLRILSLTYLEEIDENLFNLIVDSFPNLRQLRLFSLRRDEWLVELSTVAESLGRLPMLRYLSWNFVGEHSDVWIKSELAQMCCDMLPVIVQQCRALEILVFYQDFPDEEESDGWNSFIVLRNKDGGYEGCQEADGFDEWPRFTSAWDFSNYSYI